MAVPKSQLTARAMAAQDLRDMKRLQNRRIAAGKAPKWAKKFKTSETLPPEMKRKAKGGGATAKSTVWSKKKQATVAAKRIASLKSGKKTASNPTGRKG